eukprot:7385069-Prymnesium_polylepis.3
MPDSAEDATRWRRDSKTTESGSPAERNCLTTVFVPSRGSQCEYDSSGCSWKCVLLLSGASTRSMLNSCSGEHTEVSSVAVSGVQQLIYCAPVFALVPASPNRVVDMRPPAPRAMSAISMCTSLFMILRKW